MAGSWNAIVTEINNAIAKMNQAASEANAAATDARKRADEAKKAADDATTAADDAERIAQEASDLAEMWNNAVTQVKTLDPDEEPTFKVETYDGVKRLILGIPKGEAGLDGEKGDTGNSGVTFRLENSTLYIQRNA